MCVALATGCCAHVTHPLPDMVVTMGDVLWVHEVSDRQGWPGGG